MIECDMCGRYCDESELEQNSYGNVCSRCMTDFVNCPECGRDILIDDTFDVGHPQGPLCDCCHENFKIFGKEECHSWD